MAHLAVAVGRREALQKYAKTPRGDRTLFLVTSVRQHKIHNSGVSLLADIREWLGNLGKVDERRARVVVFAVDGGRSHSWRVPGCRFGKGAEGIYQ